MAHPVETYLKAMHTLRSSGGTREETSFYTPLANLMDAVGASLTPAVFCVPQVVDTGSGSPDFGLYTSDQRQKGRDGELVPGVLPERGVLEVKGVASDVRRTASGEQATRYWGKYAQVLVTNYRDFLLVGRDEDGQWAALESFRLAADADDFWQRAANPRSTVTEFGDRLVEYLKRALLSVTVLTEPEDVAWLLASYARDAKSRMDAQGNLPGLQALREGMEVALGMKFAEGESFFRSTLVQTMFYGVFSSWVLWTRKSGVRPADRFDWRSAAWNLHVPMIANLFSQLMQPEHLQPLGLDEVMDWAASVLNRVDRAVFFGKFEEEHAVQYFYEPFLRAYDPELRKDLGVWYTPPEIVTYQVERVDTVLREELGIQDGLADPNVYVLDPCCGTGAYLVETLRKIHATLAAGGAGAMTAARLKEAAKARVIGFEILPAPFVIAHLQLGLLLRQAGSPLNEKEKERVGVYLTNALTGWEPAKEPKPRMLFPELEAERAAADHVKQDNPILVVLGNPPYNAFAGVSPAEEAGLVDAYKEGLVSEWKIRKFNLDDLYVRFFRIAERRIMKSGRGVVSFISNFSYLGDPSFVIMRQRMSKEFNSIWVDCLNGDSRETGKLTPDGLPDPSVFSHAHNKEGIRVGTAVCVMARHSGAGQVPEVRFRHFWGVNKREEMLSSLKKKNFDRQYKTVVPAKDNRYSFLPGKVSKRYREWVALTDLCAVPPMNGLMEKRGGALIDIDRNALEKRMQAYFDKKLDWDAYAGKGYGLTEEQAGFIPVKARNKALSSETFTPDNLVRYCVRPFDSRWCYYTAASTLWNRSRPTLWAQCWEGNSFFVSRPAGVASPEGIPAWFTAALGDNDALRGHAYYFPLRLKNGARLRKRDEGLLFAALGDKPEEDEPVANLSPLAREYLAGLGIRNPDADEQTAGLLWHHALAICCSPSYRSENADGIKADWPRIPLPNNKKALINSAKLGRTVAALMDSSLPFNTGMPETMRAKLRMVAMIHKTGDAQIDQNADDLSVTAGWGHFGADDAVMPGRGRVASRPLTSAEKKTFGGDVAIICPTGHTLDIYLNDDVCWKNIPEPAWKCVIGGYQVLKKWLSYRDYAILARNITLDEVDCFTAAARRAMALSLLAKDLDDNYGVNR